MLNHFIGGFSATTTDKAIKAAATGVQVIFQYGYPPTENEQLGKTLQSLHLHVIDGFIASNLHYYECQRSQTLLIPPPGLLQHCPQGTAPTFANDAAFFATIATHLQQARENQLIVGYWVLDDWAAWDAGNARPLLTEIHQLIRQYTPDRPAICGFGGDLTAGHTFGWHDWIADNFTPQGCDAVGIYVYATSISALASIPSPETYDWSMSSILPAIFASLRQRGWNSAHQPLIGIGQAFGGPIPHTYRYRVVPTAANIERQSQSFCEHGAVGLTFYGWSDSEIGPASQSPMNSREIELGIQAGIASCTHYWNHH